MSREYHTSEVKVFIDGLEVTNANFFLQEVQVIEVDSEEATKFLKCRFDFSGSITLGKRSARRLKRLMRKHWMKQWWKENVAKVQGWFKLGS